MLVFVGSLRIAGHSGWPILTDVGDKMTGIDGCIWICTYGALARTDILK